MGGGELIGLVAVVLTCGIPIAGMYTYFRTRRLKSEERMAAIARGVAVPMEPELSQVARSRRSGILLVCTAIGYTGTFAMIARVEPDTWIAAAFGLIPFAIGVGFFIDSMLVKRDLQVHQ
jgi:type IV secretory pathway TrbD component